MRMDSGKEGAPGGKKTVRGHFRTDRRAGCGRGAVGQEEKTTLKRGAKRKKHFPGTTAEGKPESSAGK